MALKHEDGQEKTHFGHSILMENWKNHTRVARKAQQ